MDAQDRFIIPLSLVGRPENVSSETVRRFARRLEDAGELTVERTPTGRGLISFSGYTRLRHEILSGQHAAA